MYVCMYVCIYTRTVHAKVPTHKTNFISWIAAPTEASNAGKILCVCVRARVFTHI